MLTTSREPIGVAGEVTWRVPLLSLADEAIELFTDRARLARPEFGITDDDAAFRTRFAGDSMACRWRSSWRPRGYGRYQSGRSFDSLHDQFCLLTGGSRTAVRRQFTLRASVDWSHALLTEPERVLFRRLAVFTGGFDLDAGRRKIWSGTRSSTCSPCWWTNPCRGWRGWWTHAVPNARNGAEEDRRSRRVSEANAVLKSHQSTDYTATALAFESTTRVDHEQLFARTELKSTTC